MAIGRRFEYNVLSPVRRLHRDNSASGLAATRLFYYPLIVVTNGGKRKPAAIASSSRPIDRPLQIGLAGLRIASRHVQIFMPKDSRHFGQLCAGIE